MGNPDNGQTRWMMDRPAGSDGDSKRAALLLLKWNMKLGADEVVLSSPVSRKSRDMPVTPKDTQAPTRSTTAVAKAPTESKPVNYDATLRIGDPALSRARTEALARQVTDLDGLREAIMQFEDCDLREEATNMVFCDGNPDARVMLVGEAPGRDEDLEGKPFVGRSGKLLDRMFAEIGLSRNSTESSSSLYITNVVNWRPEGNRQPTDAEISMFRPFVEKHISLIKPQVLVLLGNPACQAIIRKHGITMLRGKWFSYGEIPVMPMFHPAYLLRNPTIKRKVWDDLLKIKHKLTTLKDG